MFSVDSKKAASFTVEFHPHVVQPYAHVLTLTVRDNPYENYSIALAGEGYQVRGRWWDGEHWLFGWVGGWAG